MDEDGADQQQQQQHHPHHHADLPKIRSTVIGGSDAPRKTKGRGFREESADRYRRFASRNFDSLDSDGGHGSQRCSRQPSVPSWEKKFCYYVGLIPWKKVIEVKGSMPIFKNVAEWNDSAGKEAFHNAKARYWAQINRLPCNNFPLPDPDMYIDKIDWNCKVDPEMVADLEVRVEPSTNDECNSDHLRSEWESRLADEPIVPTGWVSAEDHMDNNAEAPAMTGWDDWGNGKNDAKNSRWDKGTGWVDVGVAKKDGQWGNWESDTGWVKNATEQRWEMWKRRADDYYPETRRNNKREGNVGGWHSSRNPHYGYKGGEGYHQGGNNSWRNCRGRRRVVS